jgi:O-acetyl-ADP-ribose deacetylase (regulator of RNase III)
VGAIKRGGILRPCGPQDDGRGETADGTAAPLKAFGLKLELMDTDLPNPSRTFGNVSVTLVHDNIAARNVDVLVNGANDQLVMGGGVASALLAHGGIEIQQQAIAHAPAPLGSVVRTGAGQLRARYIYHAVVIGYDVDSGTAVGDVIAAVHEILRNAATDGVHSIAMPLFGAGAGGLGVQPSLEAILETIEEGAGALDSDLEIEIVVRDEELFKQAGHLFRAFKDRTHRAKEADKLAEEYLKTLLKSK